MLVLLMGLVDGKVVLSLKTHGLWKMSFITWTLAYFMINLGFLNGVELFEAGENEVRPSTLLNNFFL